MPTSHGVRNGEDEQLPKVKPHKAKYELIIALLLVDVDDDVLALHFYIKIQISLGTYVDRVFRLTIPYAIDTSLLAYAFPAIYRNVSPFLKLAPVEPSDLWSRRSVIKHRGESYHDHQKQEQSKELRALTTTPN
ncbi:hypothetical protein CVT26_013012 [Gymnopilus dilepis]|uniref:Uncharacterized protein n=1 Tax=Gymnopilus dilepis TaxID=231916 RepID=A0A409WVK2_9AGAR|nr:hypothetical protein CVT26_013012 [Gymnopilus dilepis]